MALCKLFGKHWWSAGNGWGTRKCRLCGRHERSIYDVERGAHWVLAD